MPGSNSYGTPDPGVVGRVAASTPGYKLKSLRDLLLLTEIEAPHVIRTPAGIKIVPVWQWLLG